MTKRATKVSHQKREAMVALAADGLSNRQIGERLQGLEASDRVAAVTSLVADDADGEPTETGMEPAGDV